MGKVVQFPIQDEHEYQKGDMPFWELLNDIGRQWEQAIIDEVRKHAADTTT